MWSHVVSRVYQGNQASQDVQACRGPTDRKEPPAQQDSQDAMGPRGTWATQGTLGLQGVPAFRVDQDNEVQRDSRWWSRPLRILKEQQDHKDEMENTGGTEIQGNQVYSDHQDPPDLL
ncbi:hypothetical protein EYF80_055369 [Liparis tanakae]|uniref:Uncharacterized protein n=1 Tax=Liparis tanakae TaxID=230148 RepID=A0A4Z2F119_9TELE|nr:hypothetical protein EYF80_055369 [Liparis tanakae]